MICQGYITVKLIINIVMMIIHVYKNSLLLIYICKNHIKKVGKLEQLYYSLSVE